MAGSIRFLGNRIRDLPACSASTKWATACPKKHTLTSIYKVSSWNTFCILHITKFLAREGTLGALCPSLCGRIAIKVIPLHETYRQLHKFGGPTNLWVGRGVVVPFGSGLNACEVADLWKIYSADQGHALNNVFTFHHSKLDVFNLLWRKINTLKCNFSLKRAKSQSCRCWHYVWHTSYVRLYIASRLAAGEEAHACNSSVRVCDAQCCKYRTEF